MDDILDLLSAEDDGHKAKESSRTKKEIIRRTDSNDMPQERATTEGKPITYNNHGADVPPLKGGERSLRGAKNSSGGLPSISSNSIVQPVAATKTGPQIKFDDGDDDDILSGLGFGDEDRKSANKKPPPAGLPKKTPASAQQQQQQVLSGSHQSKPKAVAPPPSSAPKSGADEKGEDDGELFQFGGYVPSVADPSPRSRPATSGRKRGGSEPTSRPSTAPPSQQAKKVVRFSDKLEESSPPPSSSSSPSPGKAPRMAADDSSRSRANATRSSSLQSLSKAEPAAPQASNEDLRTRAGSVSEQVLPSSARSRPVASLLDENGPDPLLGSEGEGGRAAQIIGEEEVKLEHPTFPWQKNQREREVGSSNKPPGVSQTRESVTHREDVRVSLEHSTASHVVGSELELGRDRGDLKTALQKVLEVELALEKEKADHSQSKVSGKCT